MLDRNLLALPGARKAFGWLLAFSLVDAVLIAVQSVALAWALTLLWAGAPLVDAATFVAAFVGVYLVRHALAYGRASLLERFSQKTASDLREQVLRATYARGVAGVQEAGTGSSAAMVVEGVDAVRAYLVSFPPKMTDLMMIPAVLTFVLFGFDWVSGLIALVVLPCTIGYMRLLGSHAKAQAARQYGEYTILSNHFIDTLRGMPTLKAFGRSKPYSKQVFAVSERFREATIKTIRAATLSSLVLDLFRTFALAAVAIMLGLRLLDGSMSLFPGLVVLLLVPEYFAAVRRYSTDFHASLDGRNNLKAIVALIDAAKQGQERTERSRELAQALGEGVGASGSSLSDEHETAGQNGGVYEDRPACPELAQALGEGKTGAPEGSCEHEGAGSGSDVVLDDCDVVEEEIRSLSADISTELGEEVGVPSGSRGAGLVGTGLEAKKTSESLFSPRLSLANVTFSYNEAEGAALEDVCLAFPAGARVALVGVSGSGKSTLARLVAGFAAPTRGNFVVNGVLIPTLADPAWLLRVTYIPQDPYLFSDTLRNNIAFYLPEADDAAVARAVRAAGLEEMVARLPEGLDTPIGAGGRPLSGGQAQRVALARAFLDESRRVLVFDEPTAHLDIQTELELKPDMLALMEGRLVVFATHRLHWVRDMDYVVVLDGGRVVEAAPPSDLAEDGPFAHLSAQMRGETTTLPQGGDAA